MIVVFTAMLVAIVIIGQFGQGCARHEGKGLALLPPPPASAHCERFGFLNRFF